MASNALPSLSTYAWVKNPAEKVDFCMAHFVASEKNQTSLFAKNVSNLQWILEQYTEDMVGASDAVRRTLNTYLERYFDDINVETEITEFNSEESLSRMVLIIRISIVDKGENYSVQRVMSIQDGRFKAFIQLNNEEAT